MVSSATPRIGVVLPPANAAVEPEYNALLADRAHVHAARFPVLPGLGLRTRLETYNEVLADTLSHFGQLRLDAAVIACSGSHYLFGPEEDRRVCAGLGDRLGYPVRSATLATLDALAAFGLDTITLVSPYEPWLTELSRRYWEAAGITVRRVIPVESARGFSPYDVTTEELLRQVGAAGLGEDEPAFLTGTGMFTFAALSELTAGARRTVLTSNVVGAWWALVTTGVATDTAVFDGWPVPPLPLPEPEPLP